VIWCEPSGFAGKLSSLTGMLLLFQLTVTVSGRSQITTLGSASASGSILIALLHQKDVHVPRRNIEVETSCKEIIAVSLNCLLRQLVSQ
jgi:hypothetical protein